MQTEESVTEDRVDELSLKIRVFGFPSPPGPPPVTCKIIIQETGKLLLQDYNKFVK